MSAIQRVSRSFNVCIYTGILQHRAKVVEKGDASKAKAKMYVLRGIECRGEIKALGTFTHIGVLSSAWCPGGRTTAKPFCQMKGKAFTQSISQTATVHKPSWSMKLLLCDLNPAHFNLMIRFFSLWVVRWFYTDLSAPLVTCTITPQRTQMLKIQIIILTLSPSSVFKRNATMS